jgi:hypothetical protein
LHYIIFVSDGFKEAQMVTCIEQPGNYVGFIQCVDEARYAAKIEEDYRIAITTLSNMKPSSRFVTVSNVLSPNWLPCIRGLLRRKDSALQRQPSRE